jgi:hypothetical protein
LPARSDSRANKREGRQQARNIYKRGTIYTGYMWPARSEREPTRGERVDSRQGLFKNNILFLSNTSIYLQYKTGEPTRGESR